MSSDRPTNPWWKVTTQHAGTFFVQAPTKERAIERVSAHSDTVIDAVLRDAWQDPAQAPELLALPSGPRTTIDLPEPS